MKVPSKTPQEMVAFWEKELAKIDKEELDGITLWGRNFAEAKIQMWKEAVEIAQKAERRRQEAKPQEKS